MGPTTPYAQRLPAVARARFSLLRFRSPLLTEYLLLPVLRCFTSRRSLPHPMHSGTGSTTRLVLGFPIRTPSDHGSLASSPRLIAGCYVLLRLLVPRHPPCALKSFTQQKCLTKEQRCSRPLYSSRTTTPEPPAPPTSTPRREPVWETGGPGTKTTQPLRCVASGPNSVPRPPPTQTHTGDQARAGTTVDVPPRPPRTQTVRKAAEKLDPSPGPDTNDGTTTAGGRGSLERR